MATTTRSARAAALRTRRRAAAKSVRLAAHGYGANPRNAMRTPLRLRMVICRGPPVQRSCARRRAVCVCARPEEPKSFAWLFARFMRSNPAAVRLRANAGGAWKAKQLLEPDPHFEVPPTESVSSRFPQVRSARRRLGATPASESRPPFGGVPYADAR